jgi:hypothetical protein
MEIDEDWHFEQTMKNTSETKTSAQRKYNK